VEEDTGSQVDSWTNGGVDFVITQVGDSYELQWTKDGITTNCSLEVKPLTQEEAEAIAIHMQNLEP